MGKAKVIVSGVAWTVIQNIVNILYGIISVPFLINYFGKEEYGIIGLALSVNVYIQLLDLGMTNSNIRFFSEFIAKGHQNKIQKLFSLTHFIYLIIGIINTIILIGLSFCVDSLFKVTPNQAVILQHLLWILALNATFSWISVCYDQFLRAEELVDWIKKRATILKILQFIVLWGVIIFKSSIEVYFFCYIFLSTIILPLTIIKTKKIRPNLRLNFLFDKQMFVDIFPYALGFFSFGIFHFLAFNFRPLLLGGISGPGAVADYNIMNTIASVISVISGSFMQVLLPIVTKMAVKSDQNGIDKIIYSGTKYVVIILCFLVSILCVNINEIFTLYVGSEYTSLSGWMIVWLATLLLNHRSVMTSLVFTEKKIKSVAVMAACAMIIAFICYIIFIPKYGVGGVVIGFTAHEIVHTLFYYLYFLPKKLGIKTLPIFMYNVIPSWFIISCIVVFIFFVSSLIVMPTLLALSLKTIVMIIVLFYVIWHILFNNYDRKFALSIIKNLIK